MTAATIPHRPASVGAAAALKRKRRQKRIERVGILLIQIAIVVVVLLLWERGANNGSLRPVIFSKPSAIWDRLVEWKRDGTLSENTLATVKVMITGWVIAIVVGSLLGAGIGLSKAGRQFLEPFVVFFNALPNLILLPFFVIWFGFGETPRVLLVVLAITFVVAITVGEGMREVSDDYVNHARVMGASRKDLVVQVYVPSTILHILASSRTTIGYAFAAAVVAELFGAAKGLGFLILRGQAGLDVTSVYASIFVVFVLGILSDLLLALVQQRVTRWVPR